MRPILMSLGKGHIMLFVNVITCYFTAIVLNVQLYEYE